MLTGFRQKTISTYLLTALIIFAAGPAYSLHLMGDAHHNTQAHHHHDFDPADLQHADGDDDKRSCSLDHDHDRRDATNLTSACLTAPPAAAVNFDIAPVIYPIEARLTPPSDHTLRIDKPPRLTASA